tara:strand:+ start:524 stop:832 length:309 start_codon:yes stop_codon:yes gene_type:complete
MIPETRLYKQEDEDFEQVLDWLKSHYWHNGGDADAEVIVNWNKQEVKEDGVVSFYATNSAVSSAIARNRKGIRAVDLLSEGVTLFFDSKAVRPMHTVLKVQR